MTTTTTDPNKPLLERARTRDSLTLFLYNPIPGFAIVCFDNHPTKTAPRSFHKVMDDLGDRRQNLDMQFLLSPRALDDGDKSELSFGPNDTTYALFRCGPDFRELGRIEARRGYDHSKDLSSFLLRKRGDSNDKESTLAQKLGVERTKARINVYLKYMSKKHETDLGEVNSEGKAYVKSGDHDIAIIASGKGGGMVRLLSYIGKEKHGGDAELLQEVLQWNFGESFVGEYNIGVDASTTRFTLECFLHNIEENGWNEVNFNNMVCAFGGSCKTIDEKIREFKKKQEEKKLPKEERELPSEELREKRLSKYGLEKEENLTGSDKEKGRYNCWCCRKCFKTEAQLKNHMHSKKHKQSWRKCNRLTGSRKNWSTLLSAQRFSPPPRPCYRQVQKTRRG